METTPHSASMLKALDETARQMHHQRVEDFGYAIVDQLSEKLDVIRSMLYVWNDDQEVLEATAFYGIAAENIQKARFQPGEGLVGQVYRSRKARMLNNLPQGQLVVPAGTADVHISTLALFPLIFNDEAFGVLQMERVQAFATETESMLEDICRNLAAHLQSMLSRRRLERLLEASRQQTEELEAHEEELRQNMEEMQATQDELNRARDHLNWQIETLNEAAIVSETDPRGVITYVNDKFCEISGYSREALIGKTHAVVNSGYFPASYWKDMYAVIGKGGIFKDLIRNRAKEGHFYWVDSTFRAVMNDKGKPEKYIAVRFDVTEQVRQREELHQKQEELQASEEELRQNMEESHALQEETERLKRRLEDREIAIDAAFCRVEFRPDGTIIHANEKFQHISGYTLEELVGQHHRMLMPEGESEQAWYKAFWENLSMGIPQQGVARRRDRSGQCIQFQASYHPVLNEVGQVEYIQKLAFPQRSDASQGPDQAPSDGYETFHLATDAEGYITWVDEAFEQICGFTLDEVRGQKPGTVLQGAASDAKAVARIRDHIHQGHPVQEHLINYTKEGRPYKADVLIQPVWGKDDTLCAFMGRTRVLSYLDPSS